ncbi:carbohydrate ABC transporter permease [Propionibacteriaceae bacterium Y2011]
MRKVTAVVGTVLGGYLPLLLTVLVVFLPLLWMMLSSFKQPSEITTLTPSLLPEQPTGENYAEVLDRVPLLLFFRNSLIVTVVGSTVKVVLALLTAYALVFIRFPFKNVIFVLILVALMVPPQVSMLPNYLTISSLGGRNTLWGIILPGLGTAFGTFLLRQHFKTLPPSLLEAAEMDGAGHSSTTPGCRTWAGWRCPVATSTSPG